MREEKRPPRRSLDEALSMAYQKQQAMEGADARIDDLPEQDGPLDVTPVLWPDGSDCPLMTKRGSSLTDKLAFGWEDARSPSILFTCANIVQACGRPMVLRAGGHVLEWRMEDGSTYAFLDGVATDVPEASQLIRDACLAAGEARADELEELTIKLANMTPERVRRYVIQ